MQLRVLGPVEIAAEGRRVAVGSERQRLILAVLIAAHGRIVSADRLIDGVWGERAPASARKSLHSHVSRLRRALAAAAPDGAGVVVTEPDGYRVDLDGHELDAEAFETQVARARRELVAHPGRAADLLEGALGLWRGAAYGELARHDAVRAEAVRLDELRAAAAADRVDARLAVGEHQGLLGELEAAVADDPLAERPYGQLMLALYRSGRQADALAVYRRLREQLAEEVGVDPSRAVQELHERILRQDAELAVPRPEALNARAAASARARDEPSRPPADVTPARLIGRDEDVAAVARLVTAAPLVTLTGPGGVGKSSLAQAVTAETREAFDDGVVWCALGAVRDPLAVPAALVAALGVQQQGDRTPEELVLAAIGTRRVLLVLDSCEHLLGAVAAVVERILGECPHVGILVTSRQHLRLPGERVWEVTPLPVPGPGAGAADVAGTPAGALLCARAQAVEPTFALTDSNAAAIAELCRRLDGIPLALELAAARLRALEPGDLVERIDHRFEVLTGGAPGGADRHRTLHALVTWSYELLTDAEACLFDRLSVFAGPFTLAAAEHVGAGEPLTEHEVAGVLAELVDKSMVVADRREGGLRYRLLDTLRAYGAQRLEAAGAAERTRAAHAACHVRLADELAPRVRGPDERAALTQLDAAFDDLRVAHAWLVGAGEVGGALRLPAALHDDLVFRPRDEVFTWAELALALPGAAAHPAYPAAVATVARGALNHGRLDRARDLAGTALAADPEGRTALWALYVLTTAALYEGRLDDALALVDRRVALARSLEEGYHRALAGVSRVLALMYRGDTRAAADVAADARGHAQRSGNHTAHAWALYASGEALLDTDPAEAAALLEQAIAAAQRVDRTFIEGVALVSLASLSGRRGETDRALVLFREAVAHWRRLGAYTQQLTTLRNLVELLVRVEAFEPAAVLHGAVTAGATPSFGAEADRLAAAWEQLEARLGAAAAEAAAARGRAMTHTGVVDTALATLDTLLPGAASLTRARPE